MKRKKEERKGREKKEKEEGREDGEGGMQGDDLVCFHKMAQLQLNLLDNK